MLSRASLQIKAENVLKADNHSLIIGMHFTMQAFAGKKHCCEYPTKMNQ
jgi:hypothetical protein